MSNIYMDNAATTKVREEVSDSMISVLKNNYGNPSSSHSYGRSARSIIELSRNEIAKILNVKNSEIIFTSGGTEGDNLIIRNSIKYLGVKHIITSKIEHHAVTHTVDDLQKKMDFYSDKKDYERAAIYRDKVQSIRDTQKKQNVLTGFDDLDVFVIKRNKFNCCLSVLKIEDGWITSSQNFYPDSKDTISDQELLSAFLESYVVNNTSKTLVNLLFKGEILKETKDFLADLKSPKITIHKPNKHNKNLIDICSSQADDALSRNRNFSWVEYSLEHLAKFLQLETINKIEGFDISHTSGKNVSASCVSITKDGPNKKNYRIMNLKKDFNNDYFALSEAIQRRCKNLQKNNLDLPEVILLDGGKGQLNTVKKNLDKKFLEKIKIISVSKGPNRKEKYDILHSEKSSYELTRKSEISKLIQLVRNESHRFAINHHRKRRSKEMFLSNLDGIEGLGPKLKTNLIRHFGGIDKVKDASLDELKSAPGIGVSKAKRIFSYLKNS